MSHCPIDRPTIDPDTLTVLNMRFCPYAQRTILCLNAKEADYRVRKLLRKEQKHILILNIMCQMTAVP